MNENFINELKHLLVERNTYYQKADIRSHLWSLEAEDLKRINLCKILTEEKLRDRAVGAVTVIAEINEKLDKIIDKYNI